MDYISIFYHLVTHYLDFLGYSITKNYLYSVFLAIFYSIIILVIVLIIVLSI